MSNWFAEASKSWQWLQWMREVVSEDMKPISTLPTLIDGMGQWDAAVAADRHGTGDPDQINHQDHFVYAAAMLSRAAKDAIGGALEHAIEWGIDDPINWHNLSPDAREHWASADHVVKTVLAAWIGLWDDLAELQNQVHGSRTQQLEQWRELADQAAQTVAGFGVAAWAQTR